MKTLNAQRLREVLEYNPTTGDFTWLVQLSNKGPIGARAGTLTKRGCIAIGIDGRQYKAHQLAWLYMTGEWPVADVDHKDTLPTNNAWLNLRDVPHQVNTQNARRPRSNNKTGLLGVHRCSKTSRFRASISVDGKCKQLGRFDTPELAHAAYVKAKRTAHEGCTL